jgi:hypothetical protein
VWVLRRAGPIRLVVVPTCSCGRRFVVCFDDLGPTLQAAAKFGKPEITTELALSSADEMGGGNDAIRN